MNLGLRPVAFDLWQRDKSAAVRDPSFSPMNATEKHHDPFYGASDASRNSCHREISQFSHLRLKLLLPMPVLSSIIFFRDVVVKSLHFSGLVLS